MALTTPQIAETVRRKYFRAEDFGLEGGAPPKKRHMAAQGNYARASNNIRNPRSAGLFFDLLLHMQIVIYNTMFQKDIVFRNARHIVFASDQMLARLREARTWYIDATFKCVDRKLFSQVSFNYLIY